MPTKKTKNLPQKITPTITSDNQIIIDHPGMDTSALNLTGKQEAFAQEYVRNGGNATAAYRTAYATELTGKDGLWVDAHNTRHLPNVSLRIEALGLQIAMSEKNRTTKILKELERLAWVDPALLFELQSGSLIPPGELPEDVRRCIQAVEVIESYAKGGDKLVKYKYKIHDKVKAAELLGKIEGSFARDNRQQNPGAALGDLLVQLDGASRGLPGRAVPVEPSSAKVATPPKQLIAGKPKAVKRKRGKRIAKKSP